MSKPDTLNPYVGRPGFWNAVNRVLYRFAGPSQVGIGRPEADYVPPADPTCPICGAAMAAHTIERGDATMRTRLHCPQAPGAS